MVEVSVHFLVKERFSVMQLISLLAKNIRLLECCTVDFLAIKGKVGIVLETQVADF